MTKQIASASRYDVPARSAVDVLRQTPGTTYNHQKTMSVLLETSLGDITIDLLVDEAPQCCEK
jgi:hypothetical protein|tara:strand:- start:1937 stop:2125 length:189 start_codon:yes stop_codon:yes gene_type:complete